MNVVSLPDFRVRFVLLVGVCLLNLLPIGAAAGTPPKVDLSVSVVVSPASFDSGGRNTVRLTVHNAGPDTAGLIPGDSESIYVIGGSVIVSAQPPPFEVVPPIQGCWIERFLTEPLPDGSIALSFVYYFDSIPAGQSRTCTYDVEFGASVRTDIATGWSVFTINDEDTNLANDRIEYVFRLRPVSVSVTSPLALILLGLGLMVVAWFRRRCAQVSESDV